MNPFSPDERTSPIHKSLKQWAIGGLLAIGVAGWGYLTFGSWLRNVHLYVLLGSVILAAVPAFNRRVSGLLNRIRHPSTRAKHKITLGVGIISACYLFLTAYRQATDFVLKVGDENSYMIQMRMLAKGRLWHDPYPPDVRGAFESFFLLSDPKYASIYFPGTAF